MKKNITRLLAGALAMTTLWGCQANPEKNAVVSKNDGAFDAAILETVPPAQAQEPQTQQVRFQETFQSSDGSIDFTMNIDQELDTASLSVVEVQPYFFTEEDVRRIADILLPGAQFYERQAEYVEKKFSKSQLQEMINRATQYASEEGLKHVFGEAYSEEMYLGLESEGDGSSPADRFKQEINRMMEMMDSASDEDPRTPCEWTWKLESNYREGPEEAARRSGVGEDRQIQANAAANGVEYFYSASKYDADDYKRSYIDLSIWGTLSPWSCDMFIYRHQLLEGKDPTQEQVDAAVAKAQDLLEQIGIGDWETDGGSVTDILGEDCPVIQIKAGPVIRGTPALWQVQDITTYGNSEFGMNYNTPSASFYFSADGVLVDFRLDSPIQEKDLINEHPAILSADEMVTRAKDNLTLSDLENYVHSAYLEYFDATSQKRPKLAINITDLDFGLVRVNVKDTPGSYYYVPGMVLSGTQSLVDPDTGETLMRTGEEPFWLGSREIVPLVGINALDGSVIPVS